jgi:N-acetylmuramoyl-L-alanine amidase
VIAVRARAVTRAFPGWCFGAVTAAACALLACHASDEGVPAVSRARAPLAASRPDAPAAPDHTTRVAPFVAPTNQDEHKDKDVVGEDQVADWAQRTGAREEAAGARETAVQLEQIAVYGAEHADEHTAATGEVRIVLRFDGVAVYRRGELPAGGGLPRRLVLDLEGATVAESVPRALSVGAGGVSRVRVVPLDEGQTRISFDVGATTAYRLFFLSEPYRVVMDFRDQAPRAAVAAASKVFRIAIDAGHGGEPGSIGPNGLREAAVALSLARRVQRAVLRMVPDVRVVMTRNDDRYVSLEERAAIANAVDADLFVSIHLNASTSPDDEGGVSTFVLDTTRDEAALRLAARENGTGTEDVTQLQFILASLYRNDQVQRSLSVAEYVQRGALRGGRSVLPELKDRGVKRALFYVLVGAQMPALLVEASFITRPEEAAALATDGYRQALADGIAEGLAQYVERVRRDGRE